MNTQNFSYDICSASSTEAEMLNHRIDSFNGKQLAVQGDVEVFKDYVVKYSGNIIAGIRSCFYLGSCLYINVLFVDEEYRHKGLGSVLLQKVEGEAKTLGARLVHLDTFDFQAKDFYLKHGYTIFGTLEDCPSPGHRRYYLQKNL